MVLANRLDEAMRRVGFKSQAALARKAGIAQPTVNRILKGLVPTPDAHTVARLALACGVDVAWLLGVVDQQKAGGVLSHAESVASDGFELSWLSRADRALLTQYHAATTKGKAQIEQAAAAAEKDKRKSIFLE